MPPVWQSRPGYDLDRLVRRTTTDNLDWYAAAPFEIIPMWKPIQEMGTVAQCRRAASGHAQRAVNPFESTPEEVSAALALPALRRNARKTSRGAIFTSILALVWCQAALGQDAEPSLEETVDYMNSKLALCPAGFAQAITLDDGTSMDVAGHSVGVPGQYRTPLEGRGDNTHRVRFNMADLRLSLSVAPLEEDSRRHLIENTRFDITVFTVRCAEVGCVQVIERTEQYDGFDLWSERYLYSENTATEYHFLICDDNEAERFENALMHALEIGGAQEELF